MPTGSETSAERRIRISVPWIALPMPPPPVVEVRRAGERDRSPRMEASRRMLPSGMIAMTTQTNAATPMATSIQRLLVSRSTAASRGSLPAAKHPGDHESREDVDDQRHEHEDEAEPDECAQLERW